MALHRCDRLLRGTFIAAISLQFACSSSGSATAPEGGAPDASCTEQPVWNVASLTFTITSDGGFVGPPPADSGCSGVMVGYDFSQPEKTLVRRGCRTSGSVNRSVQLTDADVSRIVTTLGTLRTSCHPGCGADAPTVVLTVRSSGIETSYNSDFYAGCSFDPPLMPPFVPFGDLLDLEGVLDQIIDAACGPDAGDAGSCR